MLVDANILLYSVDETSPYHERARAWLEAALNGTHRIGIAWQSLWAFLRIATNPRALDNPLTPAAALELVEGWLDAPATWIPEPSSGHRQILGRFITNLDLRGNLVSDAALAALGLEFGLTIVSNDSDFARFFEITWLNPLL
ncbi:MAG TPA: TA system VapC family ribonuclease toxin [Acidimicrobiia bacterium]|nr:TA system VapC family ribonuclease toxin [Acidimicrobiia bacterium]